MKIDINNVFIGTIRISATCPFGSNFSSRVSKENAKLLKVTNNGYVDLDLLNNFLDEIKLKNSITKDGNFYVDSLVMGVEPYGINCLFVDESTLIQYEPLNQIKKLNVKKLKKTMLMDVRVPGGIEW